MRSTYKAALLAALTLPIIHAGSIDFEIGGPCTFQQAAPLRNEYQASGVTFDAPGGTPGGAILNQCAGFGVAPHSGANYLTFSRDGLYPDNTVPVPLQLILFTNPVFNVSLYVAGIDDNSTYTFNGRNKSGVDMAPLTVTSASGQWTQVIFPTPNLVWISLTSPASALLIDDLSWIEAATTAPNPVPEPATLSLTAAALALLAIRGRRKSGYLQARYRA